MKPKAFFVLRAVLVVLGAIIIFLLSFFIVSLIIFKLQSSGSLFLPGFGLAGIKILLLSFPWLLLALVLLFVVILELFASYFKLVYERPFIYSMILIVLLVLLGGILFAGTSIHDRMSTGRMGNFLYDQDDHRGVYVGRISGIDQGRFMIRTKTGREIIIESRGRSARVGDWLVMVGQVENNVLTIKDFKVVPAKSRLLK